MANRTYGTDKNLPGIYFYFKHLVLFTVALRNTCTLTVKSILI